MQNVFKLILGLCIFLSLNVYAELKLAVSIPPLKYCLEKIGGDKVKVFNLVNAAQNPETYELSPSQIIALSKVDIYFQIGLPFEEIWLPKIKNMNPNMEVIDLRTGIKFRNLDGGKDPHIWTSPANMQRIAKTMFLSLQKDSPNHAYYAKNYLELTLNLTRVNQSVKALLKKLKKRDFLVLHPAWGYFADSYSLTQIAVENENKDTGPQDLEKVINIVKKKHLQVIFVQPQFGLKQGEALASMMNLKLEILDPYAEDYLKNIEDVAIKIAKSY